MQWVDEGIILAIKPLEEKTAILSVITKSQGLHKGVVTLTKKMSPLEVGCLVQATWKARLSHHLGMYKIEVTDSPFARILTMHKRILVLKGITTLLDFALPERHPYENIYLLLKSTCANLHHADSLYQYALFEYVLVHELGFGFDLSKCALCGYAKDIAFLSPKTGRGACFECGKLHAHKALPFPWGLFDKDPTDKKIHQSLEITGFFLQEYGKLKLPAIRQEILKIV